MMQQCFSGLLCRLRRKAPSERWPNPPPTAGEVELENVSSEEIEIECERSLLQYLDLQVTNSGGEIVSAWSYSDCFSPTEMMTIRLPPGTKEMRPVSLLGNVPKDKQTPGRYIVQAAYAYKTIGAVSNALEVEISAAEIDE